MSSKQAFVGKNINSFNSNRLDVFTAVAYWK